MSRILLAALALPAAALFTAAPLKVRGTFTMKYDQQFGAPVGDAPDHVIYGFVASGTNQGMGAGDPLEGAKSTHVLQGELTRGNGPQAGYSIKWIGADSIVDKVEGTMRTTVGTDGKPRTTGSGTYQMIRGTGKFAGAKAKGTWTSRTTGPDSYVVDWSGEFTPGNPGLAKN